MNHEDLLVTPGSSVRLDRVDPDLTCDFKRKTDAREKLQRDVERLAELQDIFSAAQTHALLIVLQGMDTAGKDGAIKHVMSGVNPQGVHVYSFKSPTEEERLHDYLWRCEKALPERGRIAIFNRSYYEETIVVRVHPELIAGEGLSAKMDRTLWKQRFEEINAFERHLVRNGTHIVKLLLHISKEEQRRRLLERLDDPAKNWKFSENDLAERDYWDRYQHAYEETLSGTSTEWAPWYAIPSNHKWFMRTAIADVLVAILERLKLEYPIAGASHRGMLAAARDKLKAE